MILEIFLLYFVIFILALVPFVYGLIVNPKLVNKEGAPSKYFILFEKLAIGLLAFCLCLLILKWIFKIELRSYFFVLILYLTTFLVLNLFLLAPCKNKLPVLKYPYKLMSRIYAGICILSILYFVLSFTSTVLGYTLQIFAIRGLTLNRDYFAPGTVVPIEVEIFDEYYINVNTSQRLKVYKKLSFPFKRLIYLKDTSNIHTDHLELFKETEDSILFAGGGNYGLKKNACVFIIGRRWHIDNQIYDTVYFKQLK